MKQRISQKIAKEKYGIVISKSQHYNNYKFFLLDNGNVVDSDGDTRYLNPRKIPKENRHDKLVGIAMDLIENVIEVREGKAIDGEEYYLLEDKIIEVLKRHI